MKEYVRENIRIQFLSDDIVRLEEGKKGVFCDDDTLLLAAKSTFAAQEAEVAVKPDGTYVTRGDVTVFVPAGTKTLGGIKVLLNEKKAYVYKNLRNSGELPPFNKTPDIFPLADNPRVISPEGGYASDGRKNSGYTLESNVKDVYLLICRGNAAKLRKLYVELTGRSELVRLSTLGSWNSRYFKYDQHSAEKMILDYASHDVPLDNIVIDTDWRLAGDRGIGYDVNTELFPDMPAYFRFAHEHGVDVMFNDHPEPQDGCTSCLDPKEAEFRNRRLSEHLLNGLDTWWYDRNWFTKLVSPIEGIAPETWGMHIFSDVTKHVRQKESGNKDIYRRPDVMSNVDNIQNGVYLGIANSASHRYPFQWTGDIGSNYDDIEHALTQMVMCGDNCIPYVNPDCGGHFGTPLKDTFVRWMQLGALGTILRPHCTNVVKRFREPWAYDDDFVENTVRNYIKLRYRLLPLLYTEAYKAYRDGSPICRSLGWNYPEDKKATACKTQYMIGDNLLVAPVFGGKFNKVPSEYYVAPVSVDCYNDDIDGHPIETKQLSEVEIGDASALFEKIDFAHCCPTVWKTKLALKEDSRLFVDADGGVRVFVDGVLVVDERDWRSSMKYDAGLVTADKIHEVCIEYFNVVGKARIGLEYMKQSDLETKAVYLPEGKWINLFDGKIYQGKKTVRIKTDKVEKMPLFARLGGVIVTARDANNTKSQKWDKLTFDLFPVKDANDKGFVYEDDRNTTAYKYGQYQTTDYSVTYDSAENKLVLTIDPVKGGFDGVYAVKNRKIRVKYHICGEWTKVKEVKLNGETVKTALRSRKKNEFPLSDSNFASDSRLLTFDFTADSKKHYSVEIFLDK